MFGVFESIGKGVSGVTNAVTSGVSSVYKTAENIANSGALEKGFNLYSGYQNYELATDERQAQIELMRSQAIANQLAASGATSQVEPDEASRGSSAWIMPVAVGVGIIGLGLVALIAVKK